MRLDKGMRTLSLKGPWKEKRLRWMTRIGGSLDSDSFLTALRFFLQRGQCLHRAQCVSCVRERESEGAREPPPCVVAVEDFIPDELLEAGQERHPANSTTCGYRHRERHERVVRRRGLRREGRVLNICIRGQRRARERRRAPSDTSSSAAGCGTGPGSIGR